MNSARHPESSVATIRVSGDLTSTTVGPVRLETDKLLMPDSVIAQGWTILRLDLTTAKMIDSVGLNLLVSILKRVQKRGASMQIVCPDPNIERTLAFTRLDQHIQLLKNDSF